MRPLRDLINAADDAWALVDGWAMAAPRPVVVLPVTAQAGEATLMALQVTTRSVLGAIAFRSGGLVIDHGWLRVLGSGHPRIGGGLREWNAVLGGPALDPPLGQALIVAYDAVGGLFAINSGAWDTAPGTVHYFAPDTRAWESLDMGHAALVEWLLGDGPDAFYGDWRWPGWEAEVATIGPDEVMSIWPPLGFRARGEDEPIGDRSRRPAPFREVWSFMRQISDQIADLPDGSNVEFEVRWE